MDHPTTPGTPKLRITRRAPSGLPDPGERRLGILGGAYNPITLAHLALADAVVKAHSLHEILFCLPEVPPHKPFLAPRLSSALT